MGHDTWTDRDFAGPATSKGDQTIRDELAPGETVVWEGRPRVGRAALLALPIALFGIPFGGFALFWLVATSQMSGMVDDPLMGLFPLFGLPFLMVGAGMVLSPAWFAWRSSRTRYAITDHRAIVCEPRSAAGVQIRSYGADALTNIVRNQRGDGSGDLIFEEIQTHDRRGRTWTTRRGFFGIADVRAVETLLRSTLLNHRVEP